MRKRNRLKKAGYIHIAPSGAWSFHKKRKEALDNKSKVGGKVNVVMVS
jgi:hypothetical protein